MSQKQSKTPSNIRFVAVDILSSLERSDAYLDKSLQAFLDSSSFHQKDNSLLSELVRGCIRYKATIDHIIAFYHTNKKDKLHPTVLNALRIAVYQLIFLSKIPHSAAVNESVTIVKHKKGLFLSKLTNAILRSIVSNVEIIKSQLLDYSTTEKIATNFSFPQWMIERCSAQFPNFDAISFFSSLNHIPSITLRRNTLVHSELEFVHHLQELGLSFQKSAIATNSFLIHSIENSILLRLIKEKYCFVQDESASIVVELLAPKHHQSVLDVCAAPGGKSFSIADVQQNSGTIVSNDLFEAKSSMLGESSKKLGYTSIQTTTSDLFDISGQLFDNVLLDAPCSGLGVIRKKPDIKWRRTEQSLRELQTLQMKAIEHCSTLVKVGGTLVYSTCTYDRSENEEVVEWFLQRNEQFSLDPAEQYVPLEVCSNGYMRTFPHIHGCDGAFGARIIRKY
jgi:16S rRNA (cytosine967-C5)-methyltransferase